MGLSLVIIYALIAMMGYGIANAILKIPAKEISGMKGIFVRNSFVIPILFILLLFFSKTQTFSFKFIVITLCIGIIGYLPLFFFFKALHHGKVGVISPIAGSSVIFTLFFASVFFHESLTLIKWVAVLCVLIGVVLISVNFRDIKKSDLFSVSSGIPFALITCFLWGFMYFIYKYPVTWVGPVLTSLCIEIGVWLSSLVHIKISKESFSFPKKSIVFYIFVSGLFVVFASVFQNLALSLGQVSLVSAIIASSPIIATLFGRIVYKEKLTISQYVAIVISIFGLVLLSL
ncbi:MAG: EamA family transporter [Candidatus Woesearchaeota archaeon]|jgi:transporter family protein